MLGPAAPCRQLPATPSEAGGAAKVLGTPAQGPPKPQMTKPLAIAMLRDLK